MLSDDEVRRLADGLVAARRDRSAHQPLSDSMTLSLSDAYAVQRAVTARRIGRGERIVGWKLGYTSVAMRAQMGVSEPNFGPLTDVMLLDSGASVSANLIQPRVEPEIGLRFSTDVPTDADVDSVLRSVGEAFACLEVVDSVYPNYRFTLPDNTADGSSAAQVVVGPTLARLDALDAVSVELFRNDELVASATGAAASGHPAIGVVWLVSQLAAQGRQLRAGDIVITGGLTAAVPLDHGDRIRARFDSAQTVAVTRS
jgi:2-keto-4-pentenoate hydratase